MQKLEGPVSLFKFLSITLLLVILNGCATAPTTFSDWQARWESWLKGDTDDIPTTDITSETIDEPLVLSDAEYDRDCSDACDNALEDEYVTADQSDLTDDGLTIAEDNLANTPLIPFDNDIWQRIRAGFSLVQQHNHNRIEAELLWYKNHPDYVLRVTKRAAPYLHFIVEEIEKAGLPLELALLPIVESAYDPFAYSHGRAAGLWQFIPGTAKLFKLKDDWWYDGRRDVVASTQAAIVFLDRLNKSFDGDWLLALASYNTGPGRVAREVKRNLKAKKSTAFWDLKLPRETSTYVPRLLAISKIIADPQAYGISLHPVANEKVFEKVELDGQIDLAKVAKLADLSLEDIYRFNPGFNHWATSPKGPKYIVLPLDHVDIFKANIVKIPKDKWVSWKRYIVKKGDVLGTIAKKFNTDVATLRKVNKFKNNTIRIGDAILIPMASSDDEVYALSENQRLERKQQRLEDKANAMTEYTVQQGDSFWKIANKFGVKIVDLASWNGMASRDPLKVGKVLKIFKPSKTPAASISAPASLRTVIKKINYKVRKGDSIARIASKFNLRRNDIVKWNNLDTNKYLQPGQALTLFIDIHSAP